MAESDIRAPTLQLVEDLFRQARLLLASEIELFKAELSQSAGAASSGIGALVAGAGLAFCGLIVLLVAISLFLVRLGAPPDAAFLIVALVALGCGYLLVRRGSAAMSPQRLLPKRSMAQISSLLGRQ